MENVFVQLSYSTTGGMIFMSNRVKTPLSLITIIITLLGSLLGSSNVSAAPDFNATTAWTDSTAGTPLDISKLVLDAPAGKHGFVTIKDGHFYFEDGTRIRFWGTNLSFSGLLPSHDEADILADKLAALGFNAVRLHGPDTQYVGSSIIDLSRTDTQHLDEDAMDRFDYLTSRLKAKGIYITTNIHAFRKYNSVDQVIDYDKISAGAKQYSLFDDRMIQLSKEWATTVLTHINPYTGLALKDDPVLALLEITNENSLFQGWITGTLNGSAPSGNLTTYYRKELTTKFNRFLQAKYGSQEALAQAWGSQVSKTNLIANGDFEKKYTSEWTVSTKGGLKTAYSWNKTKPYQGIGDMKLYQIRPSYKAYDDGVLKQTGIKVMKGHTYQLSFYAKISNGSPSTLKVRFENDSTKYSYGLDKNVTLDSADGWKKHTVTFSAKEDTTSVPEASLTFNLGWIWGDVEFDNISLSEVQLKAFNVGESLILGNIARIAWTDRGNYSPQRTSDLTQFYYETLTSTFTSIKNHLTDTVGIKIPITTTQNYINNVEIKARSEVGDYMDGHIYWDHPTFPGGTWDANQFATTNQSLIKTAGSPVNPRYFNHFINLVSLNKVEGKPFIVGEWSQGFPNDYEYEAAPIITAYAQLQDWDGLFIYQYCGTCKYGIGDDKIGFFFDIHGNPTKLAQMPTYALSFIKGYVKPAIKSVVVNYNNSDVIDRNIVDGVIHNYNTNIGRGLPNALIYTHRLAKSFNTLATSLEKDLLSTIEDQLLVTQKKHISDTGELIWDSTKIGSEHFIIDTPKSQSITGFITGKSLSTTNLKTTVTASKYQYGSVSLQPLDDLSIFNSKNMLMTIVSKQYNTGQIKDKNNGLSFYGLGPTMMQPLGGRIEIYMDLSGVKLLKVNQLNMKGQIVRQLPVTFNLITNKVTITIDSLTSAHLQFVKQTLL
jgi:hypothetical protein